MGPIIDVDINNNINGTFMLGVGLVIMNNSILNIHDIEIPKDM